MIKKFYEDKPLHDRETIDEHLAGCYVLAVPTTRSQEIMYEEALAPLLETGKIRGYEITKDSTEAFNGMFDSRIKGDLVTIIHRTSDLVNPLESSRREAILGIAKAAKGVHPILVDPKAQEYIDLENNKHYKIQDGIPSFPPTSHTMIPCDKHMYNVLALSAHHLFKSEDVA